MHTFTASLWFSARFYGLNVLIVLYKTNEYIKHFDISGTPDAAIINMIHVKYIYWNQYLVRSHCYFTVKVFFWLYFNVHTFNHLCFVNTVGEGHSFFTYIIIHNIVYCLVFIYVWTILIKAIIKNKTSRFKTIYFSTLQ